MPYFCGMRKLTAIPVFVLFCSIFEAHEMHAQNTQAQTQHQVQQLVDKKAEYHRLTNGEREGYRIKIHFGSEREAAKEVKTRFNTEFPDLATHDDYQQPYFVVLVGDFNSKLEAFETLKRIRTSFPSAFIVKGKINPS